MKSVLDFTACGMGLSIAVGVSLCFIGLALMWYYVYDVVVGRGVPWEPAKPWP